MKKVKSLSLMLITVLFSMCVVSCSKDDDEGVSNYTTEEIFELLRGKWAVSGEIKLTSEADNFAGKYKGTLEFAQSGSDYINFRFSIDDGDKYKSEYDSFYPERIFVDYRADATIFRQGGKTYLHLPNSSYPFEIVNLTKNSLKLKLDTDFVSKSYYKLKGSNEKYHVYMTIQSY